MLAGTNVKTACIKTSDNAPTDKGRLNVSVEVNLEVCAAVLLQQFMIAFQQGLDVM